MLRGLPAGIRGNLEKRVEYPDCGGPARASRPPHQSRVRGGWQLARGEIQISYSGDILTLHSKIELTFDMKNIILKKCA